MPQLKIYTANRIETRTDVFANGIKLSPVPSQRLHDHSPDGFEWGYGGSGPSQLALAILLDYFNDPDKALSCYQEFKWVFIATAPFDGFAITSIDIDAWYEKFRDGHDQSTDSY